MRETEQSSRAFDVSENTYESEKTEKKQKIVRNEFIRTGRFGIPLVKKQDIDLRGIDLWCYVKTKPDDSENAHKTIHFFTYDWYFETVYQKPEVALEKLDQYYALLTPGFSCYLDMPLALQLYSTFKNRWCGAFWQKQGMRVIPTIEWGDARSFEFCFDGIEKGGVVAVATYCREDCKPEFMLGYNKMLEVIKPSAVVCYGEPFAEMRGNVIAVSPYKDLIEKIGKAEFLRRKATGEEMYPSN